MKIKHTLFILLIFIFCGNYYGRSNSIKKEITEGKIFYDKFTNLPLQTKITSEINTSEKVDGIIYFKWRNNYYKRIYKYLTPEMFGAKGYGKTDDYYAVQKMLDSGKKDCIFYFDGKKTYYNAFANNGKWVEPMKRNIWKRSQSATFLFNGAKLRRRLPEWNDKNKKNEYNKGDFYTDQYSALLYLTGNDYIIDGADFNSSIQLGTLLDEDEKPTKTTDYAVGTCMEIGLWLQDCKNVKVKNSTFSNSVFPVFVNRCENLNFENITLKYAAQAKSVINSKDMALGAGIKLIKSKNVNINNVTGYKNLNATVEIETLNSNVTVNGKSNYDYSNSLVIISSENVKLDWSAKNIVHGTGVFIRSSVPNEIATKNISGKIKIENTSWCGVLIWLDKTSSHDLESIKLDIDTKNTGLTGLFINNLNDEKKISQLEITHNSSNDGIATGASRMINNTIEGTLIGFNDNSEKFAAKVTGINKSEKPIFVNIKAKDNKALKYDISKGSKIRY